MALADVDRLVEKALAEPELQERILAIGSVSELLELAAQHGHPFTATELSTSLSPELGVTWVVASCHQPWLAVLIRLSLKAAGAGVGRADSELMATLAASS